MPVRRGSHIVASYRARARLRWLPELPGGRENRGEQGGVAGDTGEGTEPPNGVPAAVRNDTCLSAPIDGDID